MAITLDAYKVASDSLNDSMRNVISASDALAQDRARKRQYLMDRMRYDTAIGDAERQKLRKQLDDGFGIGGAIKSLFTTADPSEVANTTDLQRAQAKQDAGSLVTGDGSSAWLDKVSGLTDDKMSKGEKKQASDLGKSAKGLHMTDGKLYRYKLDKPEGTEDFVTDDLNNYEIIDGKKYKKSLYKTDPYEIEGFKEKAEWNPDSYDYKEVSDKDIELEGKRALKELKKGEGKDYYFDKEKGRWYRKSSNDKYNESYTTEEKGLGDIKYTEGVDTSKDIQAMKDQALAEDKKANPEKYERQFTKGDMGYYRQYAEDQGIYTDKFTGSKAEQIGQNLRLYENLIAEAERRGDYDAAERFNREYKANLMNIDKYWGDDRGGKYEDLWRRPAENKKAGEKFNVYDVMVSNKDGSPGYLIPMKLSDDEFRNFNARKGDLYTRMTGNKLDDNKQYLRIMPKEDSVKIAKDTNVNDANKIILEAEADIAASLASGKKSDWEIVTVDGVNHYYKNGVLITSVYPEAEKK